MATLAVRENGTNREMTRFSIPVLAAFFVIYFVWGSTYLAIRVAVAALPALFPAAIRFTIAGALLVAWSLLRGQALPTRRQWRSLAALGALMFLACYSGLFWAEKFVDSGIAAVLVATVPAWTALIEIVFLRHRMQRTLAASIALGILGVCILAFHRGIHGAPLWPCLAILGAEIAWAVGTVLTKTLPLPKSKTMNAGLQMLLGGLMLLFSSAMAGELRPFPAISLSAAEAILYLVVAGSIIAFTAYVWLLQRFSATVVASNAYVNPVVALALGHWLAHEVIDGRVVLGSA